MVAQHPRVQEIVAAAKDRFPEERSYYALRPGQSVQNGEGTLITNNGTDTIWLGWAEALVTLTTAATLWTNWVESMDCTVSSTSTPSLTVPTVPLSRYVPPVETPEQRAAREAQSRQAHAEAIRITGEMKLARHKAAALLDRNLDEQQRYTLRMGGWFDVVVHSKDGSRRIYRISRGRAGNVRLVNEDGTALRRFCIHPVIACPDEDTMLTQKLWLENDEELFLKTANASAA